MRINWKYLCLGLILFFMIGCTTMSGAKIGGMTVDQAFPDARVAKLVEAVSAGDDGEADKQIKAGADVNYVGTDGISPLLWVMYEGHRARDYRGVEYLLKAGANPNYVVKGGDSDGSSAMYFAAGGDSPELLRLLLDHKGNPNLVGIGGPLLQVAVSQNRKENIELLLTYRADINVVYGHDTAAQVAADLGKFDLVDYLLKRGLDANLEGLAKSVYSAHIRPDSEQARWKSKVIAMLRKRGIKYPPPDFDAPPPHLNVWGR
jgi:ankyrin repeat protein